MFWINKSFWAHIVFDLRVKSRAPHKSNAEQLLPDGRVLDLKWRGRSDKKLAPFPHLGYNRQYMDWDKTLFWICFPFWAAKALVERHRE